MAHACNPSTLGSRGRRIARAQEFKASLGNMVKPHLYKKYKKKKKNSQAWGWVPVVPATREAEAGEWREPERRSLQWAEIRPLHSSLGDTARLRLKKKKKRSNTHHPLLPLLALTHKCHLLAWRLNGTNQFYWQKGTGLKKQSQSPLPYRCYSYTHKGEKPHLN